MKEKFNLKRRQEIQNELTSLSKKEFTEEIRNKMLNLEKEYKEIEEVYNGK